MTQYLERAGLRLAYDDTGEGGDRPVAVLVHGWLSRRADLRALGAALAPTYRVVALDAPGHGESTTVPDPDAAAQRLAVRAQADDLAALCDHLGVSDALLVGHSAGAAVAVELAARRPGPRCRHRLARRHHPVPQGGARRCRAAASGAAQPSMACGDPRLRAAELPGQ